MTTDIDDAIRRRAAQQHGVLTIAQCRADGIKGASIRHRLTKGMLDRVSPTVLRLRGAPPTDASNLMVAVLDAGQGATVSHDSAAAMWGLPGFELMPAHVIGPRDRLRTSSAHVAVVHQPRLLLPHHVTSLDGISVVTPSRLLFDLAGARDVHPTRVERLVDTMLSRRLVSQRSLERLLHDLAQRGRPGISLIRELIDARRGVVPMESGLEARFDELAKRAGISDLERQVDVGDDDGWIGRVDFLDRRRAIVVETDTALHHGSITDRRRDEERRQRLRRDGWSVVAFTDVDVFHRPDEVVARLRAIAAASSGAEVVCPGDSLAS